MFRIDKTVALIGINTTSAKLSIRQPKPDVDMQQRPAKLDMHTEQGQVLIDQRECFNEVGLKDYMTLTRDFAEEGKQAALEAIANIASEGDMLASIQNKIDMIAEIAYNNSVKEFDYNIDLTPKSRPKIDFKGGKVDIRVEEGGVEFKVIPQKPVVDYEAGKVDIYLRQKPQINIQYIGNGIDIKA